MTAGGKGFGAGAAYGDRTPAIWVHSSRGFLVSSAVDGKYSFAKYFKPLPTIGEWTTIEVGQELVVELLRRVEARRQLRLGGRRRRRRGRLHLRLGPLASTSPVGVRGEGAREYTVCVISSSDVSVRLA